ncbi:MAG: FapA family protein [Chitinispirillaceae bacterium]|nr:FapA family protein [Chitinispirillaceae bacterium]
MKNPLEEFFPYEERNDGVYIRVTREFKNSLDPNVVISKIDAVGVINFDKEKFLDVFTRARGIFEKIGPLFEYYDEELEKYCNISITPLKASIKVSNEYYKKGKTLSVSQLIFYLNRKGVVHGIDKDILTKIIEGRICEEFVDVAFATNQVDGKDAKIEIKVKLSPDTTPKIRSDGSVDYRSIQTFTPVTEGEVLAIKYPPTEGKNGTAVTGEPIPAKHGRDVLFPAGKNTKISKDGLQLVAATTGIIFYENNLLSIAELLHVQSDVDFSVGNIKYKGDVLIEGGVKPGFVVESEGTVHIKGEVESATIISRNGSVIVERGVVGKGDTIIKAEKEISVDFAQEAELTTNGRLFFNKYLMHCIVTCASLQGSEIGGNVIGGETNAQKLIEIRQSGNEQGIITKLTIYDKRKKEILKKIEELTSLKTKLMIELEQIDKQLKTKAALLKRGGSTISERQREEVKKWIDAYSMIKKKFDYVEENIKNQNDLIKKPEERSGYIKISGNCYPGTVITLYDITLTVDIIYTNKKFRIKDNNITSGEGESRFMENNKGVKIMERNGMLWITLPDAITMYNIKEIEEEIGKNLRDRKDYVVLDLSNTHALYSSGLGMMIRVRRFVVNREGVVYLVNVSENIYEMLSSMNLDKIFPIYKTDVEFEISVADFNERVKTDKKIGFIFIPKIEGEIYRINIAGEMTAEFDLTPCKKMEVDRKLSLYLFDFSGLELIDSEGCSVLLELVEKIVSSGGKCRAFGATDLIREMLTMLGINTFMNFYKNEMDAMEDREPL